LVEASLLRDLPASKREMRKRARARFFHLPPLAITIKQVCQNGWSTLYRLVGVLNNKFEDALEVVEISQNLPECRF